MKTLSFFLILPAVSFAQGIFRITSNDSIMQIQRFDSKLMKFVDWDILIPTTDSCIHIPKLETQLELLADSPRVDLDVVDGFIFVRFFQHDQLAYPSYLHIKKQWPYELMTKQVLQPLSGDFHDRADFIKSGPLTMFTYFPVRDSMMRVYYLDSKLFKKFTMTSSHLMDEYIVREKDRWLVVRSNHGQLEVLVDDKILYAKKEFDRNTYYVVSN